MEHLLENILDVIFAPDQRPISDVIKKLKEVLICLTQDIFYDDDYGLCLFVVGRMDEI